MPNLYKFHISRLGVYAIDILQVPLFSGHLIFPRPNSYIAYHIYISILIANRPPVDCCIVYKRLSDKYKYYIESRKHFCVLISLI